MGIAVGVIKEVCMYVYRVGKQTAIPIYIEYRECIEFPGNSIAGNSQTNEVMEFGVEVM